VAFLFPPLQGIHVNASAWGSPSPHNEEEKMPTGDNPRSRANLKPIQPGEVRNPTGKNQWSTLRAKAKLVLLENFDDLAQVALKLALEKEDVAMLKFLLGGAFDVKALQVLDDKDNAQTFAELAKKALEGKK